MSVIDTVKSHPAIFGGVAALVVLYFIWPKSGGSSGATGLDPTAIATIQSASAAKANADAAVQIAAGKNTTDFNIANLAAQIGIVNSNNALQATLGGYQTTTTLAQLTNESQDSAQDFVTNLVEKGKASPGINVAGATIAGVAAPPQVIDGIFKPWWGAVVSPSGDVTPVHAF